MRDFWAQKCKIFTKFNYLIVSILFDDKHSEGSKNDLFLIIYKEGANCQSLFYITSSVAVVL